MNRVKRFFELLLLFVNSVGIVGAVLEVLGIQWHIMPWNVTSGDVLLWNRGSVVQEDVTLNGVLLWPGLFLCCVAGVLVWRGHSKKKKLIRLGMCMLLYFIFAVIFRKQLGYGLYLVLKGMVERLNSLYQFHISMPNGKLLLAEAGAVGKLEPLLMTMSVLFCFIPLELTAGFGWKHDRIFTLVVGNVFWFICACSLDRFPGFLLLFFCVTGLVAVLVYQDFETAPKAGLQAVGVVTILTGAMMGVVYFTLMPGINTAYTAIVQEREAFYKVVNEAWIPGLRSSLSGIGFGSGVDVSGNLNRTNLFSYTSLETYRVRVDRLPEGTLYLKGYVGSVYGDQAWEALNNQHLEGYYKKHDLTLPTNYAQLVNIGYKAMEASQPDNADADQITMEEVGGKGSYSLYPYGTLLPEDFRVNGDGSVARKEREYTFQYRFMRGSGGKPVLPGQWGELEEQYREYVYDSFLEYPKERLPLLTETLEKEGIRTDSVWACARDLVQFLQSRAVYDLDTGKNPKDTDFVEYFLFENHQGYCVHFASAGVLAFRYFGIPARYATGYVVSPGDFTRDTDGYTAVLTGKQAHAWAEIYIDGVGWTPVEMTPGAAAFPVDNREEMLEVLNSWQENPEADTEWMGQGDIAVAAKPGGQEGNISSIKPNDTKPNDTKPSLNPKEESEEENNPIHGEKEQDEDSGDTIAQKKELDPENTKGNWKRWLALPILGFVIGGCCFGCIRILRIGKKRWYGALQKAGTKERIFILYRNLRKALCIAGCPERAALRGDRFWHMAQEICPELTKEDYQEFCVILEKSTFGRTELSLEEYERVHDFHDKLVQGVYLRLPSYKKLLFQVRKCYL